MATAPKTSSNFRDPRKDETRDYKNKPKQRLSWVDKTKNDYGWWKDNIDYYITSSSFQAGFNGVSRDIKILYEIHNGTFPPEWFNYVINPLNTKKTEYQSFPARLRSINIARPVITELEGEYIKRPFNFQVTASGEDAYNSYIEGLTEQLANNLQQHFINELIKKGVAEGDIQNVPTPEKLKEMFETNYKDAEAIDGQRLLDIFMKEKYFFEETRKMFKDWLITGEVYSNKNIIYNDIQYERVSPLDLWYVKSTNTEYIEDSEAVVRRFTITYADVADMFYKDLTVDDLDKLDKGNIWTVANTFFRDYSQSDLNNQNNLNRVLAFHVTWKGSRKVGELTYLDNTTGTIQQMEIDENYKLDKENGDIEINWFWVNEVYEGVKLNNDIYARMRPVPVQRNEMNNISKCKLPYNGRVWSSTHAKAISIYELMLDWVKLYIIAMYKTELLMAKNIDKIVLLDKALIPNDEGWDEDKFFYYAMSTGFALVDRMQLGVDRSWNQYQVLDARLYDSIKEMINLMEWIKQQCYDIVGVSRQRLSNITSSETATNAQSAIFQSTVITEDIFTKFEEFIQKDLQGILDLTKIAYSEGKKSLYYSSDAQYELLNLNPERYCSKDLGVHVERASQSKDTLDAAKNLAQAFAQNGSKPSTVVEILKADNVAKVQQTLKRIEAIEMEQAQAQAEQDHKNQLEQIQQQQAIQKEFEEYKSMFEINQMNAEYDRKEQLAFIDGEIKTNIEQVKLSGNVTGDTNNNGIPDINEIYTHAREREKMYMEDNISRNEHTIKQQELLIKEKESKRKEKETAEKLKIEKYKADKKLEGDKLKAETSLKVAKENKTKSELNKK